MAPLVNPLLTVRVKVRLFVDKNRKADLTPIVGWRGNFLLSAAEQWLKLELTKNFKVRVLCFAEIEQYMLKPMLP